MQQKTREIPTGMGKLPAVAPLANPYVPFQMDNPEQYEANLDMEYHSSILKSEDIDKLEVKTMHVRCQNCENHCLLTINKFNDGSKYISGNRCEKGAGVTNKNTNLPNLYQPLS